ncbi:MAG: aminopeptidase [Candidatus Hodarchaeales archaeon]|jgi:leucyl aminopeptidase (aminopeptidase T)
MTEEESKQSVNTSFTDNLNAFNARDYFKAENDLHKESYEKTIEVISNILKEVRELEIEATVDKKEYYKFFVKTTEHILRLCSLEKDLTDYYFESNSKKNLLKENNDLYAELFPENYEKSYVNPKYCVSVFGDRYGQLMSFFYIQYRKYIEYAYTHKIYKMEEYNKLFVDVYNFVKENELEYDKLEEIIIAPQFTTGSRDNYLLYRQRHDTGYKFFTGIIENANLTDLRYLFRTGHYISDNEMRIARFLLKYPEEKIKVLARAVVKAYLKGFEINNKDITKKSTVGLYYKIGLERLYREVIKEFRSKGLESTVIDVFSTNVNKQFGYDHKFDNALYLTDEYVTRALNRFTEGLEKNKDILAGYSGMVAFVKFGEKLFSPEIKKENLKLDEARTKRFQEFNSNVLISHSKFFPRSENSFSMIAFPVPEIGEKFEEIFEATVEINMLDSDKYERVQQVIIDVLDQADTVHVKGRDNNETDLIVKMHELKNPEKETNFINSGATVNIPVGEVFTSPRLKGTNGVFHVEVTYQGNFRYDNLKLVFKDGFVDNYSCTNFEKEEDNKKYIEENLLFPHKSLPMGEFAIGTNTLAYVVSRKYDIMDVLTMLILEKTGPHIALGDTCFSRSEDVKRHNQFNGKEIVATDNEKSILRKTNMIEAYTNKHSDITMAFDSIDFITAVKSNGERVAIIKDGKFVLDGTQLLNEPLKQAYN